MQKRSPNSPRVKERLLALWKGLQKFSITITSNPRATFLICAIVFGVTMAIIMPPLRTPDEASHFYRSYQLSDGHLYSTNYHGKTGGFLPYDVVYVSGPVEHNAVNHHYSPVLTIRSLSHKINNRKHTFVAFNNTAVYSPVSYIPQIIAILIGKVIYPSALFMLYLGRFLNLAVYVFLIWLSIRIIPFGKWALAVIGLFPMAIHQAASLSSDVLVISLGFISVAYFLNLLFSSRLLSKKHWAAILVLALLLGFTKQTNAILILPFFFLPKKFFTDFKQRALYWGLLALCSFGSALLWYAAVKAQHYDMDFAYVLGHSANQPLQTKFVLHHPLQFTHVLFRTFVYNNLPGYPSPDFYWQSMFGTFSWISYTMPLFNVIIGYAALFAALLIAPTKSALIHINKAVRAVFGLTFIGLVIGIVVILYLVANLVGSPVVRNIQGRYFLTALPLLVPILANRHINVTFSKEYLKGALLGGVSAINLLVMVILTLHYFYA